MNRKQRRKAASQARKSENKDIEEKMDLFSKLKDKCLVCESDFDRTNIKILSEWMVVVREDKGEVNLYCPDCWEKGKKIISQFKESEEIDD